MIAEILTSIGLTPEQADLYASLLDHGPQTAGKLAKTTKIQRTYVYPVARELVKKGLVAMERKGRTTTFVPQPPERLLSQAEDAKTHAAQAYAALEGILPSLKEKHQSVETRPIVSTYEGITGIKRVFEDIYGPKETPVYGCIDLEKAGEAIPGYITEELIPLRIRNKVKAITLLARSPQAQTVRQNDTTSLRESVLLDKKAHPLPAEIDVYEDKVALLSFAKGQFAGVLIQNKDIATTLQTIFKLAFAKISNPYNK